MINDKENFNSSRTLFLFCTNHKSLKVAAVELTQQNTQEDPHSAVCRLRSHTYLISQGSSLKQEQAGQNTKRSRTSDEKRPERPRARGASVGSARHASSTVSYTSGYPRVPDLSAVMPPPPVSAGLMPTPSSVIPSFTSIRNSVCSTVLPSHLDKDQNPTLKDSVVIWRPGTVLRNSELTL